MKPVHVRPHLRRRQTKTARAEGYVRARSPKQLAKRLDGWAFHGDVWTKKGYGTTRHEYAVGELMPDVDPEGERQLELETQALEASGEAYIPDEDYKRIIQEVAFRRGWVRLDYSGDTKGIQGTLKGIQDNMDVILTWMPTPPEDLGAGTEIWIEVMNEDGTSPMKDRKFKTVEEAMDYLSDLAEGRPEIQMRLYRRPR